MNTLSEEEKKLISSYLDPLFIVTLADENPGDTALGVKVRTHINICHQMAVNNSKERLPEPTTTKKKPWLHKLLNKKER